MKLFLFQIKNLKESLFNKFEKIYNQISNLKYQIKLLAEVRDILLPRLIDGNIDLENNTIS